jgi:lipopolysaccharide/colanic/teichoic acid biosynthesis glycosyltransferase
MALLRRARVASPPITPAGAGPLLDDQPVALTSVSKRALDVTVAIVLLILTSPIWLVAAILIRMTSPGPILFRQERIGVGGVPFTCYKFRTMRHGSSDRAHRDLVVRMLSREDGAGAGNGQPHKLNGDHRIIRVGHWMRRTSVDELPQLINVLRGEMSIVGPRPPLAYEVDRYQHWQRERLTVRPGITGLWQVSGRNRLTYNQMCGLDVAYIRAWSLAGDLKIMLRTPWVMFVDRGGAS